MNRLRAILLAIAMTALSSGCLVLSVNPGYDDTTIGWDPNLIGSWVDADDKATLQIDRGEWKSYRIHYVHPIETGDLTGYLTAIGNERYLDVMPARGEDRGSFLFPCTRCCTCGSKVTSSSSRRSPTIGSANSCGPAGRSRA